MKKDRKKILFRVANPALFRTSLIGDLYEICQCWPAVLLTEKLDKSTERIVEDKRLFPELKKIIYYQEPFHGNIMAKNYRLHRVVRKLMREFNPDIVVSADDFYPAGLYLAREAKRKGALTVALQSGLKLADGKSLCLWSCLANSNKNFPGFLPLALRMALVKIKKYLGHLFYYWVLPLTVGEVPFRGRSSFVFWKESSGLRGADYSVVFSKRDYDIYAKDGVNPEKLIILGHPLAREKAGKIFKKVLSGPGGEDRKIATVMWPSENLGFQKSNYSLIPERRVRKTREKLISLLSKELAGWKIFIKPHPLISDAEKLKENLESKFCQLTVADPAEPADKYIKMSSLIVGVPPASTTLFTAALQCPGKMILSVDLNKEFLGDSFKKFSAIEYVDNEEDLAKLLRSVEKGKFKKKASSPKEESSITEVLDSLSKKQ